jgi:hypothetical protein
MQGVGAQVVDERQEELANWPAAAPPTATVTADPAAAAADAAAAAARVHLAVVLAVTVAVAMAVAARTCCSCCTACNGGLPRRGRWGRARRRASTWRRSRCTPCSLLSCSLCGGAP